MQISLNALTFYKHCFTSIHGLSVSFELFKFLSTENPFSSGQLVFPFDTAAKIIFEVCLVFRVAPDIKQLCL